MSKKMLFIYNPRSGKGTIKSKLMDILDLFIKAGYRVEVHPTQGYLDAMKITKDCAGEFDLLACSGGDGTLDEVVSGLMQGGHQTPIGYIPSGSTNDFANSLHISKNMLRAANDIIYGDMLSFDVGEFNKDTFVYIAAFGLFTDVAYETNQDLKNILGHMAYILEGAKRLYGIQSYQMTVEYGENIFEGDFIFGMITNSTSIGGFKNLSGKNVKMDDGLFEAMFVRKPRKALELQEIVAALLMAEDDTDLIESFKTNHISIQGKEEIPWTLDGEYGGDHQEVEIKNRKQAARIAVPAKQEEIKQIEKN